MKTINKLTPQGYCNGVKNALNLLDKTLSNNNIVKPIYLLGSIIHNKHVINEYINKGIILLEDKNKTRLELLENIYSGTIIISAHGASPSVYELIKNRNLNLIDTTCGYVKIVHQRIKEYLAKNYECLYIGTINHPECEGVLGISNKIHYIGSLEDIDNLNINNDKIYATNQTTLSKLDTSKYFEKLKNKYPNIILDDKICDSTTIRQLAIINQSNADLCIVVGDKTSSNTNKLYEISTKHTNIETILCEDVNSLDMQLINKANKINITSGASTPEYIVNEIIDYINKN